MGTPMVLEKTLERSNFAEKRKLASRGRATNGKFYGVGIAYFGHGSGFTGDGESRLKSKAAIDLEYDDDGRAVANIRISSTEMGQGTMTIMPQIAADGLRVKIDQVRCPFPDTKYVPDSGPTVASRTAMVVGGTVFAAASGMRKKLEAFASESLFGGEQVELDNDNFTGRLSGNTRSFQEVAGAYLKQNGPLRITEQFKLPTTIKWNQKTFEGDSYPSYSWSCNVVEIEIDELTLELKVTKVIAFYDIGRVINPVLAKGQVEGGLTQALGYAVMEKMEINQKGLYDASRMQTYVVPTALDIPDFDIDFIEYPYTYAPPGAKGVGEMPMDGLAPAIANAVKSALGVRLNELPITPEKILAAMQTASTAKGE
jgi:CO/xanthine dehydrogenase Mo-binding subunit